MKIRTKSVIVIIAIACIFFIALSAVAVLVIQPSFNNVEKRESDQAITQTISTVNYALTQLKGNLVDYADWDDTYNYALGQNPSYIQSNFIDLTFSQLGLNLVAIVDDHKNILYCQSYDLNNSVETTTSNQTKQNLTSDNVLWTFPSSNSTVSGISLIEDKPMLIVTAPIMKTALVGASDGGLLFGRYLDSVEISQLEQITDLNFSIDALPNFRAANSHVADALISNQPGYVFTKNGASTLTNYLLINDVDSNPVFVLQVELPRTAHQQGVLVENIFLGATILLTIALGAAISILLETSIIKPMTKLASQIASMPLKPETTADPAKPTSKFETDEINVIADVANDTLNKKFEAMTEVSRMVAHDLRNPLTGIKNASYILNKIYGQQLEGTGSAQLQIINECVAYSDKIVKDLLDYSAQLKLDVIMTNPKKLVDAALSTFTVPSNIQVSDEVKDDENLLLVDNWQIQRVFSNLIKNAFDAMHNGGKLNITSNRKLSGKMSVAFTDTGEGMSEETMRKLWTPFFTTKAKGLGIGLSICKRIVEAHGGNIEVKSAHGKGTTFTVLLPITKDH